MSKTVLAAIAAKVRARFERTKADGGFAEVEARARKRPPALDLAAALRKKGPRVIAEFKRASPSEGVILGDADAKAVARDYAEAGAAAISVLTEPDFFGGSLEDLARVRDGVTLPVLRKDFTLEPEQVWQARASGADAVLLIAALLDDSRLAELHAVAREAGLQALVEVHDARELERAARLEPALLGVNNRDLKTLKVDLGVSRALAADAKATGAVLVSESGISAAEQILELYALGYDGFLIGTAFMKSGGPGRALRRLLGGGA